MAAGWSREDRSLALHFQNEPSFVQVITKVDSDPVFLPRRMCLEVVVFVPQMHFHIIEFDALFHCFLRSRPVNRDRIFSKFHLQLGC